MGIFLLLINSNRLCHSERWMFLQGGGPEWKGKADGGTIRAGHVSAARGMATTAGCVTGYLEGMPWLEARRMFAAGLFPGHAAFLPVTVY